MNTVEERLQELYVNPCEMRMDWEAKATEILGQAPTAKGDKPVRIAYMHMLRIYSGFRSLSQRKAFEALSARILKLAAAQQLDLFELRLDMKQKHKFSPSHVKHVLGGRRAMSHEGLLCLAEHINGLKDTPEFAAAMRETARVDSFHPAGNKRPNPKQITPQDRIDVFGESRVQTAAIVAAMIRTPAATMEPSVKEPEVQVPVQTVSAPQDVRLPSLPVKTLMLIRTTDMANKQSRQQLIDALVTDGYDSASILELIHELLG